MAYQISDTGSAGKGLLTTEHIKAGEVIFKLARPMVTALDASAFEYACEWCFEGVGEAALGQAAVNEEDNSGVQTEEAKLSRCAGCRLVKYCSKVCQSRAWKHHHKLECKVFSSFMPRVLPPATRMVVQLALRKTAGLLTGQDWSRFLTLQHHTNFFKEGPPEKGGPQRLRSGAIIARKCCDLSESVDQIEPWIARIFINAQTLVNPIFHPLGQTLDPLSSIMNHSCMPNAVITFSGPEMTLRATQDIATGKEITISYIDPTPIAAVRQWELADRYFFKCQCDACVKNMYCGQLDPPMSFRQSKNSLAVLNSLAALDEKGLANHESAKLQAQSTDERYLNICQGLSLYLQQDDLESYPPGRQPFAWLRFEVVVELLSRGEYLPAVILSLQTYYDADPVHFPFAAHPVRIVHAYTLSKLAHHIHYLDCMGDRIVGAMSKEFGLEKKWAEVSYALLGEVVSCVNISHGEGSRLARQANLESLAVLQIPIAKKLIVSQDRKSGMGIRDESKWINTSRLAKKGWAWYCDFLMKYVEVSKLDVGLGILIQPKQRSTPTLLGPS